MNASREGAVSRRRIQNDSLNISPDNNINSASHNAQNENSPHTGREEMLYQLSEESVHWQFPKIIVGYQPMRPYSNGVHGLMLQPTMVYQAENMIYHLRNEDLTKPIVPQQNSDAVSEDENISNQSSINIKKLQENINECSNSSSKDIFELKTQKIRNDIKALRDSKPGLLSESLELLGQNNISNEHIDNSDEEIIKPHLKMLVVKTVASQTNITLQSPDSLSVKKSYDCNSAKASSTDLSSVSTQLPTKHMSETVI